MRHTSIGPSGPRCASETVSSFDVLKTSGADANVRFARSTDGRFRRTEWSNAIVQGFWLRDGAGQGSEPTAIALQ